MTRDDFFWLMTRATGLYLLVMSVEAMPGALASMQSANRGVFQPFSSDSIGSPIASAVIPLLAAFALFVFEKQKKPVKRAGGEVKITMSREDLLWVALKVLGAVLCARGVASFALLMVPDAGGFRLVMVMSVLLQFGVGAWFLLSKQAFRLASR